MPRRQRRVDHLLDQLVRPVPADHLGARMRGQPVGQRFGVAAFEQVDRPAAVQVEQDGAVHVAAAYREIVDAQHPHHAYGWIGQGADAAQQGVLAGRDPDTGGQPGPGAAGQRQPDGLHHSPGRWGVPGVRAAQPGHLLGERHGRTVRILAPEPPYYQADHHLSAGDGRVGKPPGVVAVHPRRGHLAVRAGGRLGAGAGSDANHVPSPADPLHDDAGQMRQQNSKTTEIAPRTRSPA